MASSRKEAGFTFVVPVSTRLGIPLGRRGKVSWRYIGSFRK